MLRVFCRRFQSSFQPGSESRHRRRCPDCARFAAAVELAARAGTRPEVPAHVLEASRAYSRSRGSDSELAVLLGFDPRSVQQPLSPRLRGRLTAIARAPEPQVPPRWLAQIRYAVAASLVFALTAGNAFAEPFFSKGVPGASEISERAIGMWHKARAHSELTLKAAQSEILGRFHRTQGRVRAWIESELDSPTPIPTSAADSRGEAERPNPQEIDR